MATTHTQLLRGIQGVENGTKDMDVADPVSLPTAPSWIFLKNCTLDAIESCVSISEWRRYNTSQGVSFPMLRVMLPAVLTGLEPR